MSVQRRKSLSAAPKSKNISHEKDSGPSDGYRPEYANTARAMCKVGAKDSDLAEEFGVSPDTIRLWRLNHPEFADAYEYGKQKAADRVEDAMLQRAVGTEREVVKPMKIKGEVVLVRYRERVPPDIGAGMFLLTNYRPDKWKKNPTGEAAGEDGAFEGIKQQIREEAYKEGIAALARSTANTGKRPVES